MSLGLGIIPAVLVFFWRLNMTEPKHYKKYAINKGRTPYLLVLRRYWKEWLGIAITRFIYDFITYPVSVLLLIHNVWHLPAIIFQFGIYSSTIVNNITHNSSSLTVVFGWNVVIK